jgi:hypothetical protein
MSISVFFNASLISIFNAVLPLFKLVYTCQETVENIDRLKACDNDGRVMGPRKAVIVVVASHSTHMSCGKKALYAIAR